MKKKEEKEEEKKCEEVTSEGKVFEMVSINMDLPVPLFWKMRGEVEQEHPLLFGIKPVAVEQTPDGMEKEKEKD